MKYFLLCTVASLGLFQGCAHHPRTTDEHVWADVKTVGTDDRLMAVLAERDIVEQAAIGPAAVVDRMIVRQVQFTVRVTNLDSLSLAVVELAKTHDGYLVRMTNKITTIRVPVDKYDQVVSAIEHLGELIDRLVAGKDVTDEYTDLALRLDNAEQTLQRYLALLERAQTVDEILQIERELERLNLVIEQLKGKIQRLSHKVDYMLVTVYGIDSMNQLKPGPVGYVFAQLYKGVKWLFVWE